jgi:hypothetical protein
LDFGTVGCLSGSVGPTGCVTGFDATIQNKGRLCAMFLDVNVVDGVVRVRNVSALLSDCRGFEPNAATPDGL